MYYNSDDTRVVRNVDMQHESSTPRHPNFQGDHFSRHGTRDYSTSFSNGYTIQINYRKPKEPDTYDGKKTEWNDYICHFEQVAFWNSWFPEERASQLAMCLRGSTQRALSELSVEDLSDYWRLKALLTQRFCSPERETAYRRELRNRRRKKDETVSGYSYSLKRLASHAFLNIPLDIRECLIIEQYISGLSDLELKQHVQFSHPSTLDRAISLAFEFEAFEGSHISPMVRKPKDDDFSPICNKIKVTKKADEICHQVSTFTKLIEGMQDVQKYMLEGIEGVQKLMQNMMQSSFKGQGINRTGTYKRKLQCFYCKEDGHMMKHCPVLNRSGSIIPEKGTSSNDSSG